MNFPVKAMRLLHLVGYRGNSAEFPENTLPALRSAIALGVRFIELDVHLSADGVPMVCNEHQLARVTGADTDDTDLSGGNGFQDLSFLIGLDDRAF